MDVAEEGGSCQIGLPFPGEFELIITSRGDPELPPYEAVCPVATPPSYNLALEAS